MNRCSISLKTMAAFCAAMVFFVPTAHAELDMHTSSSWDAKLTLDMAYPPSAVLNFWWGLYEKFSLLQLRKINRELAPYEHGYIRPHIRLLSSARVNHIEPRFDLYPFTFLGITGGWTFSQRALRGLEPFRRFTHYNCSQISCDGWSYLPFAEAKFKWGYKNAFGVFVVRRDWANADRTDRDLSYDTSSGLPFRSTYDVLDQFWVLAGVKVSDSLQVLARYKYLGWQGSGHYRRDASLLYSINLTSAWAVGAELTQAFRGDGFRYASCAIRVSWDIRKTPAAEDTLN